MARKEGILANEEVQDTQRRAAKRANEQKKADLRWLLGHPSGRRFYYNLVYGLCGVENGIWESSAKIHYSEGRRSVGIDLKNEAQLICPGLYLEMIQEQLLDAQRRTNEMEDSDG